jgi:molecular chaperone GrpE
VDVLSSWNGLSIYGTLRDQIPPDPGRRHALERFRTLTQNEEPAVAAASAPSPAVESLAREVERLRRTLLKQGHAQELFQGRMEEALARLARARQGPAGAELDAAQRRALIELDQAILRLVELASAAGRPSSTPDDPASLREGLDLLQIRARNLGRSFGVEPIPTRGHPFDDRLHEVSSVAWRPDLPDGLVVEEILPGYRLHGQTLRPALVVVNRHPKGEDPP